MTSSLDFYSWIKFTIDVYFERESIGKIGPEVTENDKLIALLEAQTETFKVPTHSIWYMLPSTLWYIS